MNNQQNPFMFPNWAPMPPFSNSNWNNPGQGQGQCQCSNDMNRLENRVSRIERQLQRLESRVNRLENAMIIPSPYGNEQNSFNNQTGYQML